MIGAVSVRLRSENGTLMVIFWDRLPLRRKVKERNDGDDTMRL
jgi:hypothetical protein